MFHDVEFQSEGATLRGRHYRNTETPKATIVMTHGTSATITMAIDHYAQAIFEAGFDVLLYDHRNFGHSGGEPRQEINPWVQLRGYRDAVAFLRASHQVGPVALWGDSYSGGLALVAGALIDEVAAIIAQIPVCGATWPEGAAKDGALDSLRTIFESGDVRGGPDDVAGPMPVVSLDQLNAPSLLTPPQAVRWFLEYGGRHGTGWENRVTRVVPKTPVPCSPLVTAPHLNMPVLMMIGRNDEMVHCNPDLQDAVFEMIPGPKEKLVIDGGHFGLLWEDSPSFSKAVTAQIEFLGWVL
ncbi:alpha/beta hydrolase [Dinoroseobacter sp. S76]|uniref:alpha/beta hydrolase n=1 Tax=Dinoroseobacter sp. S76 TaxID=3415124 RepID=UPI003C7A878F